MKCFVACVYLLQHFVPVWPQCSVPASDFKLRGDFLIGGLFNVHQASPAFVHDRPEAIDCSSQAFTLPSYRMFQVLRFSVEEINNSTSLLPNVTLGYDIFDHCSDTLNFPGVLKLISVNGSIKPWEKQHEHRSKVVAVVGPFGSTETLTVAPLFMRSYIPMVNYGSSSSIFSKKFRYPSFLRTVHTNKDMIQVIVNIIRHFHWRWVAFLSSDDDYSKDGLELFINMIKDTEVCLAYREVLKEGTDYSLMFKQIESQSIPILVVFTIKRYAEILIKAAVRLNVTDKVWIAGDTWALNQKLPTLNGIRNIGTVLGVSEPVTVLPGFNAFIYSSRKPKSCDNAEGERFCNQVCNCSSLNPEDVIREDPSYSFAIYSAAYAIAHALHHVLQCDQGECNKNIIAYPNMILTALKESNFTLLDRLIQFDASGERKYGSYTVSVWTERGEAENVGSYATHPSANFYINDTKIVWHSSKVPVSRCSAECALGFARRPDGIHVCCFTCEVCPKETYVNTTEDPYDCLKCKESEWAAEGSTSCSLRKVEYVPFKDISAIMIMVASWLLVSLSLAMLVLFAVKYNTPVVKSAGGPMCFLILGSLSLCSISIFFYFDKPTPSYCILRFLPFLLFYTPCLASFVVRSFQIVCVFKMAAKFPRLYAWWMKYHGQWLVITVAFVVQALLLSIGYTTQPPKPYNETFWYPDKIILGCQMGNFEGSVVLLVSLCALCFIFSYMGKDLPKNYNEAKSITFCLLLLILTWIVFATEYLLYHGKYIQTLNALAVLCSLYWFLMWYFLPKCYIIIFQPHKNTQQYFQGLIQNYTKTISN